MSNIDLKNFVDIDIQPHITQAVDSIRNTVVLYTYEGTLGTVNTFHSLSDVTYQSTSDTYQYLQMYFDNGGVTAQVYEGISYTSLTTDIISSLPNDLIYIACVCPSANVNECYTALKLLITSMNANPNIYGINEKILLARTYTDFSDDSDITVDTASVKNFAVKYSSVQGAEMTIAAYLSQININTSDSIKDYAFTEENISEEDISNSVFTALQTANMNVDILLANAVRNCGGNCKDGSDLVNSFVKIILHQTLTDSLINLLTQKIKNSTGISKIYSAIAQELEKYKNCGYLTTDKIWQDKKLVVNYNNVSYTIINKGDALLNGYVIKILPLSSLSTSDQAQHTTPPIYVIIADQYGIRKITINGDII